jgi:3-deoxy-7-phosphoheptulonate synthase
MIVVMKIGALEEKLEAVLNKIEELGYKAHIMRGVERTVVGCLGDERGKKNLQCLETFPGVEKVVPILSGYKLAGKQLNPEPITVEVNDLCNFGPNGFCVIAGPCSVESEEQLLRIAHHVKDAGAHALRGGAFKPRSSTYSFQGMGEEGLKILAKAREETGLAIVTEIMDYSLIDLVVKYADVLQIGARNMQNFPLLKAVGKTKKPVLLKRGMSATVEELLMSAEYILAEGNPNVILCERGLRTFETSTRNTLDINAVPALKERSNLPVVVDPSHATGIWQYVNSASRASAASGADGLIIEVHDQPQEALSDGSQSLKPKTFSKLILDVKRITEAVDREFGPVR